MRYLIGLLCICLLFAGCDSHDYSPKPRGFFRIEFPVKAYQEYNDGCPFTFEYPKYAVVAHDDEKEAKPCWINVRYPQFNGTLHLSYENVTDRVSFNKLVEEAHTFAYKHTVKASSIDAAHIYYPDRKVYGLYYTIDGNAASWAQFFLTDSTKHYLHCSLYFYNEPRLDSIQPVLTFIKKDMDVMIRSFKWKK